MKPTEGFEVRLIAGAAILALFIQPAVFAQDTGVGTPTTQASAEQFPDSPGTVQSASNRPVAQQSEPTNATPRQDPPLPPASESSPTSTPATQSQPPTQSQEQAPHEPLGTAAAESVPTSGVAASRPAGEAVAPAKQRRVRSILIKVGALVGAGVAIGTTMALSQGSPSRPPGTH